MHVYRIGGLVALVLAIPASLRAEPAKLVATVTMPEIESRSGPSWKYLSTGKLKKGEQVFVHHEDNSWLAIVPPRGSMSWVNHRFLGEYDPANPGMQNAIVMKENVEVRVGAEGSSGPLQVRQVSLPAGTIVKIIGPKGRFEDSTWYPIEPPAGEYRFIPRQAVGALEPAPTPPKAVVKVAPTSPESLPGIAAARPTATAPNPQEHMPTSTAISHPSWAKAEQAEAAGDWNEAERLYTQVYTDLRHKNADIDQLLACYNRIDRCRERKRGGAVNIPTQPVFTNPGGRTPATLSPPATADRSLRDYPVNASPQIPFEQPKVASNAPPIIPASATSEAKLQSTGAGWLRQAPFAIDNRKAYALDNDRGEPLFYVTAASGVILDSYLQKQVELVGTIQVRGDIRGPQYMVVTKVIPLK